MGKIILRKKRVSLSFWSSLTSYLCISMPLSVKHDNNLLACLQVDRGPFCVALRSAASQLFPPSTRLCSFRRHCSVCALSNSKLKLELRFQRYTAWGCRSQMPRQLNGRELSAKWRGTHHAGVGSTGRSTEEELCGDGIKGHANFQNTAQQWRVFCLGSTMCGRQGIRRGQWLRKWCRGRVSHADLFPIASELVWSTGDNYTCSISRMGSLLGSVRTTKWLQDSLWAPRIHLLSERIKHYLCLGNNLSETVWDSWCLWIDEEF